MKMILFSAAAVAAAAISPALAQSAPADHGKMEMKPLTRADVTQKVQEHFARLDSDKDGFVTKAEMEAAGGAMHERMKERMAERGSAMFDRMDSNKDGSISRAEFDAAHQNMAAHMGQRAGKGMRMMRGGAMGARMLANADSNNDGKVSLGEATSAAAAHFDRADANRDGTLTPDEMRAAHRAMAAEHQGH